MNRRHFILSAASAAIASPSFASVGIGAGPDVIRAFQSLPGVRVGSGRGTLQVIYAPWCPASRNMYSASFAFSDRLSVRWIPFSGGQPEGRIATERLLSNMNPQALAASFVALGPYPGEVSTPAADAQDSRVHASIEPLVIRDSGYGLVSPTLAYEMGDQRVRIVRGAIGPAEFDAIARVAT